MDNLKYFLSDSVAQAISGFPGLEDFQDVVVYLKWGF